ncbi:MAG: hypothetical protein WC934_08465 [Acidithiobacillus sp.]|jgi:hypothetical protein|uniref:hypothetical protein n=1 Tax=Acidithiobacillus sp. TaxID=1872118 RepID=UPI00355E91AD
MIQIKQVQRTGKWPDSIWYNTKCYCEDNEIDLHFQYDNNIEMVTIYFVSTHMPYYINVRKEKNVIINFIKTFYERLKCAIKIIQGDPIKFDEEFIFRDIDHVKDFITALQEGIEYMKKQD